MKTIMFFAVMLFSMTGVMAQAVTTMAKTIKANAVVDLPKEHFDFENVSVDVYLLGHASLVISVKKDTEPYWIYIDPVMKNGNAEINYGNLPKADYVLLTHDHFDHFDPATIDRHSKPETRVVGPNCCNSKVRGFESIKPNSSLSLNPQISILAVDAYNTTKEHQNFHPKGKGIGYVITLDGRFNIYVAGDTEPIPEMKNLASKKVELAFLPVNQPYTMTPKQCLEAAEMVAPRVLIPYHLGDTDFYLLQEVLSDLKVTEVRYHPEMK